jgi:hypothetical protein
VKFRIVQEFAATADELIDALVDPGYLATLGSLPGIGAPTTESREIDGSHVSYVMRFAFTGHLPSAVTRVIDPKKLTWTERTTVDTAARRAEFAMVPDHYQSFFRCRGSWALNPGRSPNVTDRTIEGDLKVSSPVPLVGGTVERAIVSGLRERLAKEPDNYVRWRSARR